MGETPEIKELEKQLGLAKASPEPMDKVIEDLKKITDVSKMVKKHDEEDKKVEEKKDEDKKEEKKDEDKKEEKKDEDKKKEKKDEDKKEDKKEVKKEDKKED